MLRSDAFILRKALFLRRRLVAGRRPMITGLRRGMSRRRLRLRRPPGQPPHRDNTFAAANFNGTKPQHNFMADPPMTPLPQQQQQQQQETNVNEPLTISAPQPQEQLQPGTDNRLLTKYSNQ